MFDRQDYTPSVDLTQVSGHGGADPLGTIPDPGDPLAIHHIGPVRSVSLFPGVVERDRKEAKKKPSLEEREEPPDDADCSSRRGRVIGLSSRSRLRLQVRINRCRFKVGYVWFLTLTYPSEFPPHCVAKDDLRAFLKRIGRKFGKHGAIWRIENQKRGAPHFHVILFSSRLLPAADLPSWLSRAWYEVVGSQDENHLRFGTRCDLLRSARGVSAYCSKYVSKPEEGERVRMIEGRQWGREGVFPEERIDFFFSEADFPRFWRILRRSRGLVGHVGPGSGYPWKNLFAPGLSEDWLRLAAYLGGYTLGVVEGEGFYQ